MVKTPVEFKNQLLNLQQSHTLGIAAVALFLDPEVPPILERLDDHVRFGTHPLRGREIATALRTEGGPKQMMDQFMSLLSRALIKEGYDYIKTYCEETRQLPKLRSQPWYNFSRIVRNAVTHNGRVKFENWVRPLLPISWGSFVLDVEHDGIPIEQVITGHLDILNLVAEMYIFAEEELLSERFLRA